MFIQTEDTPNPNALKFLPGCVVSAAGPYAYTSSEDSRTCPLASALFDVAGVRGVFVDTDYIAITRYPDSDWAVLKPQIFAAIADRIAFGAPLAQTPNRSDDDDAQSYEGESAEIVAEIKNLLETRVRPAVAGDGGDIAFRAYDQNTGVVTVFMRGACAGCPSSTITLKSGIENLLRHYIPEVTAVEAQE